MENQVRLRFSYFQKPWKSVVLVGDRWPVNEERSTQEAQTYNNINNVASKMKVKKDRDADTLFYK